MNCYCGNCGWSEIVGSPIMCNYSGNRTWRDECCEAWKPKDKTDEKDMVAVVRCKDCRWFRSGLDIDGKPFASCVNTKHIRVYGETEPDFYCGYAEQKDGDGDV